MLGLTQIYEPEIPAPGVFRPTGSMTGRSEFGLSLLPDGRVLMAGGTTVGIAGVNVSEIYDPDTGTWSATGDLNQIRMGSVQLLLPDGTVLITGGDQQFLTPLASSERFDPSTGSWSVVGALNTARSDMTGVGMGDGRAMVCGGISSLTRLDTVEVFDAATEQWTTSVNTMSAPALM